METKTALWPLSSPDPGSHELVNWQRIIGDQLMSPPYGRQACSCERSAGEKKMSQESLAIRPHIKLRIPVPTLSLRDLNGGDLLKNKVMSAVKKPPGHGEGKPDEHYDSYRQAPSHGHLATTWALVSTVNWRAHVLDVAKEVTVMWQRLSVLKEIFSFYRCSHLFFNVAAVTAWWLLRGYQEKFPFPFPSPLTSQRWSAVNGVRKEKERLTAAKLFSLHLLVIRITVFPLEFILSWA